MEHTKDIIRVVWAVGLNLVFLIVVTQGALAFNNGGLVLFSRCVLEAVEPYGVKTK